MYILDSSKLGAIPSWFDMFDLTKHPLPVIETKTPAAKETTNTNGTTDTTTTSETTIDLVQAKALINKYGVILASQIMKGVKTIAQADAEVAANIAAKSASQAVVQAPATAGSIVNTIVSTVKSNWPLFLIGGVLLVFGSGLFKSRR